MVITFTPLAKPTINTTPSASGGVVTICDGLSATLSAPAGFNYTWSDTESSQNIIVTQAGSFTVTVSDNGGCVSPASDAITVNVNDCDQPPVIQTTSAETHIEGSISISLLNFISDPDNNLDLSTLKIITPPASGAQASIDGDHNLIIDYKNVSFSGRESITIEVCDLKGKCSQQTITLDVAGDIVVYNAFSPNSIDSINPVFYIEYINVLDDTKHNHVSIFNRWGDVVFEIDDYDNANHVFIGQNQNGNDLPAGDYFYKIDFSSGKKSRTGFVSIKR